MNIRLHAAQSAFRQSPALYRGFVGGRGAGKSWIGAYDMIRRAKPGRLYMACAPTYPMLRDSTLRSFEAIARDLHYLVGDLSRTSGNAQAVLGNGATVLFRSADDPDRLRGGNLSGAWMDEASVMTVEAYQILIGCLREAGEQGWLSATFTPRGLRHWTYDVFGRGKPDTALIHSRTADNPFLSAGFADTLRAQYPSQFARQEIDGEFVAMGGQYIKRDWFRIIPPAAVPQGVEWARGIDLAVTVREHSDYTASVRLGRVRTTGGAWAYYIDGGYNTQLEYPQARQRIISMAQRERITLHIEAVAGFVAAYQDLRAALAAVCCVRQVGAHKDKLTRALPWIAAAEAGSVALVRTPPGAGGDNTWLDAFLDQCDAFPAPGTHDDLIDAVSIAWEGLCREVSHIA